MHQSQGWLSLLMLSLPLLGVTLGSGATERLLAGLFVSAGETRPAAGRPDR